MAIWYILWSFCIFYVFWCIFWYVALRKIWQPWLLKVAPSGRTEFLHVIVEFLQVTHHERATELGKKNWLTADSQWRMRGVQKLSDRKC
jgi:hypothetical protein